MDIEADVLCFSYLYGTMGSSPSYGGVGCPGELIKLQMPSIHFFNTTFWHIYESGYNSVDDLFKVGTIKFKKKLKIVEPTEAKLEIQSFASPPEGAERLARFVIKNAGDGKASIDGIKSSGKERKLICDKKELEPSESAECVAIVDRNDRNMRLAYTEQPCGKPKHSVVAISLDIEAEKEEDGNFCESNPDCSTGEECCVNLCRPAAEGVCDDIDSDGILDTWVPFR